MNKDDRKFLTEWIGDCWHKNIDEVTRFDHEKPYFECTACLKTDRSIEKIICSRRTFDTSSDLEYLKKHLIEEGLMNEFISWRWFHVAPLEWEMSDPGEKCQGICDFLKDFFHVCFPIVLCEINEEINNNIDDGEKT